MVIVDDTLSTGGAVISLVEAVRRSGAEVVDVVCAVEKVQNNGREQVLNSTGVAVKTLVRIVLSEDRVRVLD